MSDLKNYIVTTKKGINIKDIEKDLCRDTTHDPTTHTSTIPDREVDITHPFKFSTRNTQFALTKEEAKKLRNDPRIEAVMRLSGEDIILTTNESQLGDHRPAFWTGNNPSSQYITENSLNYINPFITKGLSQFDGNNLENIISSYLGEDENLITYDYTLDGEGVDLVVVDVGSSIVGGINSFYHQEFVNDPSKPLTPFKSHFPSGSYVVDNITGASISEYTGSVGIRFGNNLATISAIDINYEDLLNNDNRALLIDHANIGKTLLFTEEQTYYNQFIEEQTYYNQFFLFRIDNINENSTYVRYDVTSLKSSKSNSSAQIQYGPSPNIPLQLSILNSFEEANHRLRVWDWYTEAGVNLTFDTPQEIPYSLLPIDLLYESTDAPSHGIRCASTAAGSVFGLAKKSLIYPLHVAEMRPPYSNILNPEGGNELRFIEIFSVIKNFHEQKPIDPKTGFKRPTVVTISVSPKYNTNIAFELEGDVTHIDQIYYTGSSVGLTGNNNTGSIEYGFFSTSDKTVGDITIPNASCIIPLWFPSIAADADECSDIGIIIVNAVGNESQVVAGSGSSDDRFFKEDYYSPIYNSYFTFDVDTPTFDAGDPIYYCRVGVPGGNSVVNVGQYYWTNSTFKSDIGPVNFAGVGNKGPRVDILAPVAGFSGAHSGPLYPGAFTSSKYQIPIDLNNSNNAVGTGIGTSFAAPVVAGVACLWKQLNPQPEMDVVEFKKFLSQHQKHIFPWEEGSTDLGPYIDGSSNKRSYTQPGKEPGSVHFPFFSSESIKYNNISIKYT